MRTVNSDFLRSYDKLKQDVFHSKKEEHKQNLRSKAKPLQPISLKKIFPWKTLTKLTTLAGIVYLAYNYTGSMIDQIITKNYFNVIDLISLKVLKQDLSVKLRMIVKNPSEVKNMSHFANYTYKNELQTSLNYLKKIYPTHKLKSSIHSGLKIWIFQFNNIQKSQYVNEFGDVIQRDENSFMRIWRYPIFKDRKEKVVQQEKVYLQYRTMSQNSDDKRGKREAIQNQIVGKCQKINIFNRFSSEYDELLTQCRKNQSFGQAFTKVIQSRKRLYPYTSLKVQNKSQTDKTDKTSK